MRQSQGLLIMDGNASERDWWGVGLPDTKFASEGVRMEFLTPRQLLRSPGKAPSGELPNFQQAPPCAFGKMAHLCLG